MYPDVKLAGIDPLSHYIQHGVVDLRDPAAWFSTRYYLDTYQYDKGHKLGNFPSLLARDKIVELGGLAPVLPVSIAPTVQAAASATEQSSDDWAIDLVDQAMDKQFYASQLGGRSDVESYALHYLEEGWLQGLDPAPDFETSFYLAANADVSAAGINPFVHYLAEGRSEGRLGAQSQKIDVEAASSNNDDVRALISAEFSEEYYRSNNRDLPGDIRYLDHFVFEGWKQGRDPNPFFSVSGYLEMYPDVRASGMNPFQHFILAGRQEGRVAKQALGYRYEVIKNSVSITEKVAQYDKFVTKPRLSPPAKLQRLFGSFERSQGKKIYLSVSHDDYTKNFGGVQLVLMRESMKLAEAGWDHIHLFPSSPSPVVDADGDVGRVGILVNGAMFGHFKTSDVTQALAGGSAGASQVAASVHSLLGHNVVAITALIGSLKPARTWFWIHDYASLCAGFTLMRNDVQFCSAPELGSAACQVCSYQDLRAVQSQAHSDFMDALKPTVVAPSAAALKVWKNGGGTTAKEPVILPHGELVALRGVNHKRVPKARAIRVGFLGLPSIHKGWGAFRELALQFQGDDRYEFHHLGKNEQEGLPIKFTEVVVSLSDLDAMSCAVRDQEIDVALIWSLWPETFCITAYEAIVGGAAVLTPSYSGNVADMVTSVGFGDVIESEEVLFEIFKTGVVSKMRQKKPREVHELQFGSMTADLIEGL
ncbi:hypothetical protein LTR94_024619 [Friedmanniomyces endolithicus]|nr:hypothetical protein LTR94_024619 [Friedmanniomyces endolithicus]